MLDIPTDNLYKFMAVGGIILFIAGVYYPRVFFHQTGLEYLAQLRGDKEFRVHHRFISQRLETLNFREQQLINQRNELQKRLAALNSSSNSTDVEKLESRIKEVNRELDSLADSAHELRLNLELKRLQSDYEETVSINRRRDSRLVLLIGFIVSAIGGSLSVIGFRRWYKRLQVFQDQLVIKDAEAKLALTPANDPDKALST